MTGSPRVRGAEITGSSWVPNAGEAEMTGSSRVRGAEMVESS